ncbi:hypothetical protein AOQ84DRAFT_375951 [Glonium stellatum]|uniref:Uncharacterized protein n=1 Tax=Glonium stellatum TaxID=574774 RepID=A0A8E2F385_9PEZI|nr:hypothetical protein AOQ84DRAFT_375951 [Glonium stellatum]
MEQYRISPSRTPSSPSAASTHLPDFSGGGGGGGGGGRPTQTSRDTHRHPQAPTGTHRHPQTDIHTIHTLSLSLSLPQAFSFAWGAMTRRLDTNMACKLGPWGYAACFLQHISSTYAKPDRPVLAQLLSRPTVDAV